MPSFFIYSMKNRLSKYFFFAITAIIIFSCGGEKTEKKISPDSTIAEKKSDVKNESVITITAVGDIMMGTTYPYNVLPPEDGKYLFEDVKEELKDADITFGNLEGPLLDAGGTPKQCRDGSHCVAFRSPTRYAEYLKDAGFDIVSVANNHAGDMGDEGRVSTMETLGENEIGYAGFIGNPAYEFEVNGVKVGFTAFAPNNGCLNLNDWKLAKKIIGELDSRCDVVIVSFHGGAEGSGAQHVNGVHEIFLGEDRGNVYEFAHDAIDFGADVVLGHGPHVTRAIELYEGRLIAYSLGNFCTYGKFGLSGELGLAPILKIKVDKNGKFIEGKIIPTKQVKRGIPMIDGEGRIIKTIINLTKKDFPESGLEIDEEGNITKN